MWQLANFSYKKVIKKLKNFDCVYLRTWKWSHEIRYCNKTWKYTTIPRHNSKDIKEWTLRAILRQLNISPNDFLNN